MSSPRLMIASVLSAALTLCAVPALADQISYSANFGNPPTGQPVGFSTTVTLPKYNPALFNIPNELVRVMLTVQSTSKDTYIRIDNEATGTSQIQELGIGARVNVTAPQFTAWDYYSQTSATNFILGADSDGMPPDFVGSDAFTLTGQVETRSSTQQTTSPSAMAYYTGGPGDTFSVDIVTETSFALIAGTGQPWIDYATMNFGNIYGTVTVTYFNPVPEPAAMALMGLGLVGLTLAARRRRTN